MWKLWVLWDIEEIKYSQSKNSYTSTMLFCQSDDIILNIIEKLKYVPKKKTNIFMVSYLSQQFYNELYINQERILESYFFLNIFSWESFPSWSTTGDNLINNITRFSTTTINPRYHATSDRRFRLVFQHIHFFRNLAFFHNYKMSIVNIGLHVTQTSDYVPKGFTF